MGGVNATYFYQCAREKSDRADDVGGDPFGHFLVVCLRRNYPYRDVADGLATWLRRRFADPDYAGFELEVNQAVFQSARRRDVERTLVESLDRLLEPPGDDLATRVRRRRGCRREEGV